MTISRSIARAVFVGALLFASAPTYAAEPYPTRPIKLVIPWPAGGIVDALGRTIGKKVSDNVGQPVVVENRVGAAGAIAADFVAKSAPDGYTLLLASSGHAITAALSKNLPYDSLNDFTPVRLVATAPSVLVAHPGVGVQNATELIALAKTKPGKLTYASAGTGSFAHILAELFRHTAQIDLYHVPYRGQPQAMTDLLGGRVDVLFATMTVAIPQIEAGKMRALGVTAKDRVPALPDVPTLRESGVAGFEDGQWMGLLGPKGLDPALVQTIGAEVDKALRDPEVRAALEPQGMYIVNADGASFRETLASDIKRWTTLVAETGLAPN